jgi:DNA replication protein DnaC
MTTSALLSDYLKRLKLPAIGKAYDRLAEEASARKASYQDYLCCLLEQEVQARNESTKKTRIAQAKFPALKTLDTFDFDEIPTLNKKLVLKLFGGQYLHTGENIVFIGGQGTGKTHLSIALGMQACADGKTVKFFTAADLVHQLIEARDEKALVRFQQQLAKCDLLIMDELGRIDGTQDGANLLFQVLGSRYERKSTIITTNLDFENWSVVFMTKNLTAAVLDRLNHRCHLVDANGESYRFKESLRKKTGAKTNTGVNSPPIRTAAGTHSL